MRPDDAKGCNNREVEKASGSGGEYVQVSEFDSSSDSDSLEDSEEDQPNDTIRFGKKIRLPSRFH